MNTKPLVSILINNYNYDKYLKNSIDSALSQTYKPVEVIVVDDGSTDISREIIESYGSKIRAVLKENGGQASAFNLGFQASDGEIICFLDSDDTFLPTKVEKTVEIFCQNPDASWFFHPLKFITSNAANQLSECRNPSTSANDYSGLYDFRSDIARGKLSGRLPFSGAATSGICFRRALLDQILPMPEAIKITSDDYIKYVALGISKGFILSEPLANQLIHGNNAYTLRNDKQQLRAKIQIQTAYWMRKNFQELSEFSNSIFVAGKRVLQEINSDISPETQVLTKQYLRLTSRIERIRIGSRLLYRRLKP